jgi:hypothetical protein
MEQHATFSLTTDDKNDKHSWQLLKYVRFWERYQGCLLRWYTGINVSEQPIYQITQHYIPEHHIKKTVIWYTNMKYNKLGSMYLMCYYAGKHFIFPTSVWEQNPELWLHTLTTKVLMHVTRMLSQQPQFYAHINLTFSDAICTTLNPASWQSQ